MSSSPAAHRHTGRRTGGAPLAAGGARAPARSQPGSAGHSQRSPAPRPSTLPSAPWEDHPNTPCMPPTPAALPDPAGDSRWWAWCCLLPPDQLGSACMGPSVLGAPAMLGGRGWARRGAHCAGRCGQWRAGSPHWCYAVRRPLKTPGHEVKDGEPSTKRKLGSRFNKQENRFNVKASRREKRSLVLRAAAGGTRRLEPAARQAGLRGDSPLPPPESGARPGPRGDSPLPPPSRGQLRGCEQRSDVNGTFSRST